MFSKKEFFVSVALSLVAGIGIGYTKARGKFTEALIKATPAADKKKEEGS